MILQLRDRNHVHVRLCEQEELLFLILLDKPQPSLQDRQLSLMKLLLLSQFRYPLALLAKNPGPQRLKERLQQTDEKPQPRDQQEALQTEQFRVSRYRLLIASCLSRHPLRNRRTRTSSASVCYADLALLRFGQVRSVGQESGWKFTHQQKVNQGGLFHQHRVLRSQAGQHSLSRSQNAPVYGQSVELHPFLR